MEDGVALTRWASSPSTSSALLDLFFFWCLCVCVGKVVVVVVRTRRRRKGKGVRQTGQGRAVVWDGGEKSGKGGRRWIGR